MHIPDNYISPSTSAVLTVLMLPVWFLTIKRIKNEVSLQKLPILGISSALSFLIMMFNIPLPGGTTGHAVGASLIAILIGPYAACLSVTVALLIQAVFFGDGGILAFGANCFNMAFIMPFSGYYLYRLMKNSLGNSSRTEMIAVFVSSYISLNLAALSTAIQFGVQPLLFTDPSGMAVYAPYPLSISIPAMMIPHLLVAGFIEGFISLGVYSYVSRVNPDIIYGNRPARLRPIYATLILLVLVSPLGLIASGTAWGEWDSSELGKMLGYVPKGMAEGFSFSSVMPDYTIPVINNEIAAYIISAFLGTAIILISFKLIRSYIRK